MRSTGVSPYFHPRKTPRLLAWVAAMGEQSPPGTMLLAAVLDVAVLHQVPSCVREG